MAEPPTLVKTTALCTHPFCNTLLSLWPSQMSQGLLGTELPAISLPFPVMTESPAAFSYNLSCADSMGSPWSGVGPAVHMQRHSSSTDSGSTSSALSNTPVTVGRSSRDHARARWSAQVTLLVALAKHPTRSDFRPGLLSRLTV